MSPENHPQRIAVLETKVKYLESRVDRLSRDVDEMEDEVGELKLTDREVRTNMRLYAALGSAFGTFLVGLGLFIATRGLG